MVKPKKYLGQHFLTDHSIAQNIVNQLSTSPAYSTLIELGPGTGVLTQFIRHQESPKLSLVEIDKESVTYLKKNFPPLANNILETDFLTLPIPQIFPEEKLGLIGNFPYHISTQIMFKVLAHKDQFQEVVGMFQKEVAERICSVPGKKAYGILSVFLQAYYTVEYLFTVGPEVFDPPPKVDSGVIRLQRNQVDALDCNESLFRQVVKQGFNQRRKTLRNALKAMGIPDSIRQEAVFDLRAERLSVQDFVDLSNMIEAAKKGDTKEPGDETK